MRDQRLGAAEALEVQESRTCCAGGCARTTSGRKPYCRAHLARLPYVRGLLARIAAEESPAPSRLRRAG